MHSFLTITCETAKLSLVDLPPKAAPHPEREVSVINVHNERMCLVSL